MATPTRASRGSKSSSASSSKLERKTPDDIKPASPIKVGVSKSTEAVDLQYEVEKMRSEKKRAMRSKQINTYTVAMYGSPQEKEEQRKEQRECLLKQIRQKEESAKMTLKEKVKESETAVAFDKECLENDKREQMKKASYLTQFRDGNKQLIELRAEERKRQRAQENYKERELLKQNPLNWSNTLS